jgi:Ran GTPase-activating protein (RanGAP) involved in mRNA processing and transport
MSGGKAGGKQAAQYNGKKPDEGSVVKSRDMAAAENEVHSCGHTHRKSMRLKDMSAAKQAGGKGETEKGKQPAEQKTRTRTTRHATQTQPLLLAADAPFAAALEAIPAEDWGRTWAAGRTIMLRRTAKRVKEIVDKMRLPAVVRLSMSFWGDARNGTDAEKLQLVMRQLTLMTGWCRISTLALPGCDMKGQDAERLAGVLARCPALAHLDLSYNYYFGAAGAERLAGVLGQCRELVHLDLCGNQIGDGGAERLARVLAQCASLAHLDLSDNEIGSAGAESLAGVLAKCASLAHLDLGYNVVGSAGAVRLAGVLGQCPALAHLNLRHNDIVAAGAVSLAGVLGQCSALAHLDLGANWIGPDGAESLAGVLAQCAALAHLDLSYNQIGCAGAESLAGVLAQCTALAHLDLSDNEIGAGGAERLAGVLAHCTALAHLDLRVNDIGTVGQGRLRASWRGQASGLFLRAPCTACSLSSV